jgi:bifunctional UDP-N-acetylglucosamine pyrophosphorylase/glucosamine-1-phosphate N-acetyltransferase
MRSALPKVMHRLAGEPLLGHVLRAVQAAGANRIAVVVGPDAGTTRTFLASSGTAVSVYEQAERRGTAHAVLAARKAFADRPDDVIVAFGDTPLITAATLRRLRRPLAGRADLVALGFRPPDPTGYGRLVIEHGSLAAIREEKDATAAERSISLCNAGVMAFRGALLPLLRRIGHANAKQEYYLTDLVALAKAAGKTVVALEAPTDEVVGVNTRAELAAAEAIFQREARRQAMEQGATLIAPETVHFAFDTRLGRDVVIEPHVFFGPGVTVADGAAIRAFSHIEGATIAAGAIVGPFARLRPGARIGEAAHIGNFVEVKNAAIDAGAKANHLAYIGDAHIGARTNVGAGAITCNYDGVAKHHTEIGADVFIGSNAALVAPVTIGDRAYVGTGSVINRDVEQGALAIARARQENKPGYAAKLRVRMTASKKRG